MNEVGGLFIRIVLGGIFMLHGLTKFQNGVAETIKQFESYQIPYAEIISIAVIGIELIGGFFLIIGFSTRFVSFLMIGVMIGAIFTVKLSEGFLFGYEYNVALIAMSLYLVFAGSRFMAVDQLFLQDEKNFKKGSIQFRN